MSQKNYEQRFAVALRCRIIRDGVFYNRQMHLALDNDVVRIGYNNFSTKIKNLSYKSENEFVGDMKQFIEKLRINQIIQDTSIKEIEDKIAVTSHNINDTMTKGNTK
jgi:hypothetical protein